MKKFISFIIASLLTVSAYADNSKVEIKATADDGQDVLQSTGLITKYFTSGTIQQQYVTLTASAFTNISIPSGAKAMLIDVISADGIKLKGVTGDTGISLDSTVPVLLPITQDGTATIGIQNLETASQRIKVYFF